MNPQGKKFVALFLIFSLITINCSTLINLERKREKRKKHGALLIIHKIDGAQIKGELIAVKPNSLLLLDSETGADVSVDYGKIKVITIVKKSKTAKGIGFGLLIGGASGAYFSAKQHKEDLGIFNIVYFFCFLFPFLWFEYDLGSIVLGGSIGALAGGFIGEAIGKDKTIQVEGKSDLEKEKVFQRLRSKARIPDFK